MPSPMKRPNARTCQSEGSMPADQQQIPTISRPEMLNRQTSDTSGATTTPSCSESGYQLVDQPKTTATYRRDFIGAHEREVPFSDWWPQWQFSHQRTSLIAQPAASTSRNASTAAEAMISRRVLRAILDVQTAAHHTSLRDCRAAASLPPPLTSTAPGFCTPIVTLTTMSRWL
jgi:hypothetical protein